MVTLNITDYTVKREVDTVSFNPIGGPSRSLVGRTSIEVTLTVRIEDPKKAAEVGQILAECKRRGELPQIELSEPGARNTRPDIFDYDIGRRDIYGKAVTDADKPTTPPIGEIW